MRWSIGVDPFQRVDDEHVLLRNAPAVSGLRNGREGLFRTVLMIRVDILMGQEGHVFELLLISNEPC